MQDRTLPPSVLEIFRSHLQHAERSPSTIEKYLRSVRVFACWLNGRTVTKDAVAAWKAHLVAQSYAPVTVNAALSALNSLFQYLGWEDCRVRFLKIQRRLFREPDRELDRSDYLRLVRTARQQGKTRLALLMETICATGIRVSEVSCITLEAAQSGKAEIALKGKIRTILLPSRLCLKLLAFARKNKTASGEIFLTRSGKGLCRKQIWLEMKQLCGMANVESRKVFPHNLRHLFARCFYRVCRDVAQLADILGHSSIDTTRIYLISTGSEHVKTLERLHLIL